MADLESSDRFPCAPTETKFIDTFCIYNPSNRDYYGQRLKSFFRAPETGNYRFQTSCDDVCQLWISDNEQSSRKRLIINQKHSTEKFRFSRYALKVRAVQRNREFKKRGRLRQRQRQKAIILLVKRVKNDCAARAARIFVHFSAVLVKTTT